MPYDTEGLASLSLTLGFIVLLLWVGVSALRRLRGPGAGVGLRDCTVLRSLALGPRERLVVVRVGSRQLVVGVGSASVSLLCELDEPLASAEPGDAFAATIRKAVDRWRGR